MRLSRRYVLPHISTGDMLRAAVKARTALGLEARRYLDAGDLIPDKVVLAMIAARLDQDDTRTRGFCSTVSRGPWPRRTVSTSCWSRSP